VKRSRRVKKVGRNVRKLSSKGDATGRPLGITVRKPAWSGAATHSPAWFRSNPLRSSRYLIGGPSSTEPASKGMASFLTRSTTKRLCPRVWRDATADHPASTKKRGMCQRPMNPQSTSIGKDRSALRM
jgi:hypothetical protein